MGKQQQAQMRALAAEAFQCWKQEGHPGWTLDDRDSSMLDEMHQREVRVGLLHCIAIAEIQQKASQGGKGNPSWLTKIAACLMTCTSRRYG